MCCGLCLSAIGLNLLVGISPIGCQEKPHGLATSHHAAPLLHSLPMAKPLTLEIMQQTARKRGGEVLSKRYVNARTAMRFRCSEGHEWSARVADIRKGHWCHVCSSKRIGQKHKLPWKHIVSFAREHRGKCLSAASEYENVASVLRWQCEKGHTFETCFGDVRRRRHFCPECGKQFPRTTPEYRRRQLQKYRELAASRCGKLLAKEYVSTFEPLRFRCAEGHEWETPATNVQSGNWCRVCGDRAGHRNLTVPWSAIVSYARKHRGRCLSKPEEYQNLESPLRWRCRKSHVFTGCFRKVRMRRNFCLECRTGR